MIWDELCEGLGSLVDAVMHKSYDELPDHGEYDNDAEELMDGVSLF